MLYSHLRYCVAVLFHVAVQHGNESDNRSQGCWLVSAHSPQLRMTRTLARKNLARVPERDPRFGGTHDCCAARASDARKLRKSRRGRKKVAPAVGERR